jgi:hypothetical protein
MNTQAKLTDVTPLFETTQVKIDEPIFIEELPGQTYEYEDVPEDNWLFFIFKGLQELSKRVSKTDECMLVGTGNGIDAIGAAKILNPNCVIITDISKDNLKKAEENCWKNLKDISIIPYPSDLFQSIPTLKADVICTNLPNIPVEDVDILTSKTASVFKADGEEYPNLITKYLLVLQYKFLVQAKNYLTNQGSVVVTLGGRIPKEAISELFKMAGYSEEYLFEGFKVQTQPEEVMDGYANAEKDGVVFDFYDYGEVINHGLSDQFKISATEVLSKGIKVGHKVYIIRGIKS